MIIVALVGEVAVAEAATQAVQSATVSVDLGSLLVSVVMFLFTSVFGYLMYDVKRAIKGQTELQVALAKQLGEFGTKLSDLKTYFTEKLGNIREELAKEYVTKESCKYCKLDGDAELKAISCRLDEIQQRQEQNDRTTSNRLTQIETTLRERYAKERSHEDQ